MPVALGPDEASARRLAAWWLSTYLTRMGPLYLRMLGERFGMTAAVNALVDAADGNAQPDLPLAAEELHPEEELMELVDVASARYVRA